MPAAHQEHILRIWGSHPLIFRGSTHLLSLVGICSLDSALWRKEASLTSRQLSLSQVAAQEWGADPALSGQRTRHPPTLGAAVRREVMLSSPAFYRYGNQVQKIK